MLHFPSPQLGVSGFIALLALLHAGKQIQLWFINKISYTAILLMSLLHNIIFNSKISTLMH